MCAQITLCIEDYRGNMEGPRMHWLAESLYFLVVLCLLRECGVPGKVLLKVQQNQMFKHISEQLSSQSNYPPNSMISTAPENPSPQNPVGILSYDAQPR